MRGAVLTEGDDGSTPPVAPTDWVVCPGRHVRRARRRARCDGRRARPGPLGPAAACSGWSGPAGIGKTSLIRRLLVGRPDVRVLWGGGDEGETGLAVRSARPARRRRARPARGPAPGRGTGGRRGPAGGRRGAADRARRAAGRPGRSSSWSTTPSGWTTPPGEHSCSSSGGCATTRSWSWSRRATTRRTSRDGGSEAWPRNVSFTGSRLGGLDAEEIVELSAAVGGPALTPEAGRRLRDHTGGHPLHATALLAELPPDALVDTSRILPAPRSFASLVLVRVATLSPVGPGPGGGGRGPREAVGAVRRRRAGRRCPSRSPPWTSRSGPGCSSEVPTGTGHDVAFPPRAGPGRGVRRPAPGAAARAARGGGRAARRHRRHGSPGRRRRRAGPRPRRRADGAGPRRARRPTLAAGRGPDDGGRGAQRHAGGTGRAARARRGRDARGR